MPDGEKPAFAILHYAWINLHKSSTIAQDEALRYILGKSYTEQDAIDLSTHYMVSATTSPTILLLCDDDALVPSTDGAEYYEALVNHGVKATMHIYPFGGHSVKRHTTEYRSAVIKWLKYLGMISDK
jgi:acetyl esterase/lipase